MTNDDTCNVFLQLNCMKKQNIGRTYIGIKMTTLESAMKSLNISSSYSKNNLKTEGSFNLNECQQKVYKDIEKLITKKRSVVIVIDSLSGTGKTFLLSTLAKNKNSVKFITFRRDQASDVSTKGISSETYVSFCMKHFNLEYQHAVFMFNSSSKNKVEQLYSLILYSQKYCHSDVEIIILDTYTIASPKMLLLLYLVALKQPINLIFAGSSLQLSSVVNSSLHGQSNFSILQIFNDMTVKNLSPNMRLLDPIFEAKLTKFLESSRYHDSSERLQFHFNLGYQLFCLFRSKYFSQERFDTVYIAQRHVVIKQRLTRFIEYLKTKGIPYVEAPFYKVSEDAELPTTYDPICKRNSKKFNSHLILAEGYKYIYVNESGVHSVVELVEILYNKDNTVDSLRMRCIHKKNDAFQIIKRCILNYYQILPAYRRWLLNDFKHEYNLFQFPLRQYALTYHSAIGRTIETEDVELNVDCAYVNSIYVGLSCVRHESSIHKIHSNRDLLSYVVTEYMEQEHKDFEYYYRCPKIYKDQVLEYVSKKGVNDFIESINWVDVENIDFFETRISTFLRIKRSAYTPSTSSSSNIQRSTPLMEIAQFIKEKPSVILNTMSKISQLEENGKLRKKKRSSPYIYLKEEYDAWTKLKPKKN